MVLGVTGNIASGKSQVVELLRCKGAVVLSADQLAREVVAPGSVLLRRLVDRFGRQILRDDGSLDRKALAQLVFADDRIREELNRLMHPAIARLADERLAALRQSGAPLIVYEAPLLYETGAETRVDRVLVVTIDPQVQLARLCRRDQLEIDAARQRIAAQMAQDEKAARADYCIDNSGSHVALEEQVKKLWMQLTDESRGDLASAHGASDKP